MSLYQHHHWIKYKTIPWVVCQNCGLIAINNPFTQWCIKHGCNHIKHKDYQRKRMEFTQK